ncbi:MAG: PTS sugar transporter subunit IIB [Deltaproteobacteria bacterium]|nr:PTS sugar transporter subunit IIB [Deltaproteobacteria bacterium]
MPIVLVRVDDRLVHGQILEGWLPSTRAQELLIANDSLANDFLQKMIMQSAIPYSVNIVIDTVQGVATLLRDTAANEVKRIVLVDSPRDALRLKRAGVGFNNLNLGNLRTNNMTICLSRSVMVGEDGLRDLRTILAEGVKVVIQSVPFEKPLDLSEVLRCFPET